MTESLLPIPKPEELRPLEVLVKPDWRGVVGRTVGALLWLGERLRILAVGALIAAFVVAYFAWWLVAALCVVALGLLVAEKLGLAAWCATVLDDWVQVVDGRVMLQRGRDVVADPPGQSILDHESVHDWCARTRGKVRYALEYALIKRLRQHFEAMAYAYEVVHHGRDPEEAAVSASKPVYAMGWNRGEARELIDRYAAEYRR